MDDKGCFLDMQDKLLEDKDFIGKLEVEREAYKDRAKVFEGILSSANGLDCVGEELVQVEAIVKACKVFAKGQRKRFGHM